jgi:hypothetical protein
VGPHPHDLYLATFGRSAMVATTVCLVQRLGFRTHGAARQAIRCAAVVLGILAPAAAAHGQDLPSGPISLADGRITLGTEISLSATPQDDGEGSWFNYTDYERNALRLMRLGLTAEVRVTDRISFLTEIRSENGASIEPYAVYARVRPWKDRSLDIQAGRIPPTFGAFARRNYAAGNPLIGYPLAYQYLTSIRPDAVPSDTDDLLRMRARGWRPSYPLGSLEIAPGMPLITAFQWDTGVQVRLGAERLMVAAALTNGTVSDPRTKDNNGGKQISGRAQWRPNAGLSIGASAARGPYVSETVELLTGRDRSMQRALGFDAEYSRDHWLVRSELIWNEWQIPTLSTPARAASVFVEGSYKIVPGVFVASRVDRLGFSRVTSSSGSSGPPERRSWDAPVTRIESGVGVYIRRNLLAKGAYQHNWRDGGRVTSRGLLAFQLQFWL